MKNLDWRAVTFLGTVHVLGVLGIFYSILYAPAATNWFGLCRYIVCMFAITAGYHRLYAHCAYKCARGVQIFFAIFGAMSFQHSILEWVKDHRHHHWDVDTDKDPHNIKRGLFWAHIGCWLSKRPEFDPKDKVVADLYENPVVQFQYRHYRSITIFFGIILPWVIPLAWGDYLGGLFVGSTSLLAQLHTTYSVNSLAHKYGKRDYGLKESGADNIWVSIVTLGEGQQNRHHIKPWEWHNGIWYDPTGWLISTLFKVDLAWDLK